MDQKVWPVQLGRVYRPVFEAEEMLVRSLKKNCQKAVLPSVKSSDSSEFHENDQQTDDQLVYHLPDRLPSIQSEKSERLRNLEERRKNRHEKIVEKMKHLISETIKKFHRQFEEISKSLKCQLARHKTEADQLVSVFDDPDKLEIFSESDFDSTWSMLENIIKASESAIAKFRSSCQALESSLIKSTGEILESTLLAMNKNGLLVEKENRKIIENESMVLNQVFFANNRTCSKILKALATDHTTVALQTRVAFTERKSAWIDVKNESAKSNFFEYLDQQELRNPSFVEEILNDLRENQSQAISRRTDLLLSLSDPTTMNMEEKTISSIITNLHKIEAELESRLHASLSNLQDHFRSLWHSIDAEEEKFLAIVKRFTTEEQFETTRETAKMSIYELSEDHQRQIYELDVVFEDLSSHNKSHIASIVNLLENLSTAWNRNQQELSTLQKSLETNLSIERTNHDSAQLELESFISLKTDELAQANSQQIIERYEGSLAKLFEQKDIKIDEFKNACSEHERAYQRKVEEQEEFFAAEISQICNLEEELLENRQKQEESPSNSPESEEQDVSWGRELEIRAAKKAEKGAKGAKKDGKHASLEKLPTFTFTAEDFEIHDSVPFSIIAEIGDEILTQESVHRAVKDAYLKKTFIQEIKQDFKLFVARFYEARKSTLSSEIEKSLSKKEKILGKEIKMMKKFNSNRLVEIKSEISAVRIEQLKDHEKLLSLHEGNIKAEISNLISQSKELNKIAKKQLENSKEIGPKLLEMMKETKFSRELKEIRKFFCSEFDKAEDDLKSIFTNFNEQMEHTLSEIKRANTLFLKNYEPFSSGGCFSDFEKEEAEKRLIKLEKNLVRAMRNIGKEIEKNLPKRMRDFEDLKKESISNMENFEADLDFIARLDKEIRRIKIEVSGLKEDHKLSFNELDRYSTTLKMMDRAILSPTHEFPNVTLEQLQKQWKTVRESVNKIVTSYKARRPNDESASELKEFYEKWLLEREKEKSPSPSLEMQINRFGRRMSSLRTDNSARKALSNKISRGQQNTTETQTTGIVRRIIRDPKSQLKFNIFALDNPPEVSDLPTKITSEMMCAADNALEIIDDFFKKKGPREILFCKTPESMEKALCYLEDSLEKIYSTAQKSLRAEFKRFEAISRSLEKIEGNLPSKIFNSCFSNFEKRMRIGQEEVRKRNEFLEEALEEAKNEHFNQLRVNLGHPDDLWKLEKINEEENDRVLRESKFIKDKAEEEIEMLTEEISASLSQIYEETKFLSASFSERTLFDEIMEENLQIEKSTIRKLDCEHLPDFENEEIHVTKKTLAHLELEKDRQLLYLKLKTFYTEKKLAVRNEEANALEDLHRWEGHFASHIADIKRLFSSST